MYTRYVETGAIKSLPTYQLSQDPLESLFSRIRSLNGNCDNPPVTQFTSAIRKILLHNEITSSHSANCADHLKILTVSSRPQSNPNEMPNISVQQEEEDETFRTMQPNENDFLIDCFEESTISLIATSIEQKIIKAGRFECECEHVLVRNNKVTDLTISEDLVPPCISTLYICKVANICFNFCRNKISFNYDELVEKIMGTLDLDSVFQQFFTCDQEHKIGFTKYIIEEFIRKQGTYIAKNLTLIEQKILCRKVLQKTIHFRGQLI